MIVSPQGPWHGGLGNGDIIHFEQQFNRFSEFEKDPARDLPTTGPVHVALYFAQGRAVTFTFGLAVSSLGGPDKFGQELSVSLLRFPRGNGGGACLYQIFRVHSGCFRGAIPLPLPEACMVGILQFLTSG